MVKKYVGAHVSAAGGVENAPKRAADIGAKAFALFTKNQRQWKAKPLSETSIQQFQNNLTQFGFTPEQVLPHDSYLINLGHPETAGREKSLHAFIDEMERCHQLGLCYLNFHPGSHLRKSTPEACLKAISTSLNQALSETEQVIAVLETTAGQGSNMGYRLEHLAEIIQGIKEQSRIGVCVDTCHVFAAGYNIAEREGYEAFWQKFDDLIGFDYLKGLHINDSKAKLASRVDRHHSLGEGEMGWEPFRWLMNDARLDGIPMILETIDQKLWPEEIKRLYESIDPS
ncbi:deoxyribonuclease IV [Magnetococcales bacterium HHB-1]